MLVDRYYVYPATVVGGTWSGNTPKMVGCYIQQIVIRSTNALTTFDVRIEDLHDTIIRKWEDAVNVVNDLTPTPIEGIVTVIIYNSTADEDFEVLLVFTENQS